ncbi:MAG TPA: 50S ribosomal protein L25 [Candidatus Saccharibacteria bacterium]|jgi:large subunit ribosomal protein L25|nr:50S ribosomal protein L25 [Candidatus Saccharibacteria bacterium]HMT55802.1 50S ribosomal protein L25 [Candidatus Saccharibacteria bacterium]
MSSETISLNADKREVVGKQVKSLRKAGQVPATVYEKGKESLHIQLTYLPLIKAWHKAGKHHPIEIVLDGKKHMAMIKDVSVDPVKATLTHVSFHAIKMNQAIEAEVPIHMVGQAPASANGLLVRLNIDHVLVKGLPNKLPDAIEIDVSHVENEDDDIRMNALVAPEGVELVDVDADAVLVSVTVPRAEVEKETEEEVSAADVPSDNGGDASEEA